MQKEKILIFTRYPRAGEVKTRLIPDLGAQGASSLHAMMTEFTVHQAVQSGHAVHIYYTGASEQEMRNWLGYEHTYVEQGEGDLGQRMHRAFVNSFEQASKVLLLGSDCPNNRTHNLQEAFSLLDEAPCVLGPSVDGGYYMVGLRQDCPEVFCDIAWGSEQVLSQTLAKLDKYALVETLQDVDYYADIPQKISVIIPTYNEEERVVKAIASAQQGFNIEIIVADGGSSDATVQRAQEHGALTCVCPLEHRGRAQQMNYALNYCTGEIVLFLHADSILPKDFDIYVRKALEDEGCKLGYFNFAVSGDFFGKSLLEWGTNIRAKRFHMPYGDQGFFMRKADFLALSGYAQVPILEDVFLVKAVVAKYKKTALQCVPLSLVTSGRRWQKRGFLRVTLFNQLILWAARFGMDLNKVRDAYRKGSFF